MDMKKWLKEVREAPIKKAMPILSFPSVSLLDITVRELINDSDLMARGMKAIADRVDSLATASMMDLSVEAEAFGAAVRISDNEVPTVFGAIVQSREDAEALQVPAIGAGRTSLAIEAVRKACGLITDRPVFAGVIGPFSLAGRLMDLNKIFSFCKKDPDTIHAVMEKTATFVTEYIKGYKASTGASGVLMAEPLTGLLSPKLAEAFSEPYVKRIVDEVQTDDFIVIYHNCGNYTIHMIDSILRTGAAAYHFGNAIDMKEMLSKIPPDVISMGNVDPAGQFCNGTPGSIKEDTKRIMGECCRDYSNFVISSGCDIPPASKWENIDAFFEAVREYYLDVSV